MSRRLLIPIVVALAALPAAAAQGETVQRGNLRVAFEGRLSPRQLPRERPAPVTARLDGSVRTVDGSDPPPLRRISVAVNRRGRISFAGLPTCPAARLTQTTTEVALARCRPALVGHGRFAARVAFPSLVPIPAEGKLLAFAGRWRGRRALLLHIYGSAPVRATFVLPFVVSRPRGGSFGTVLTASIPTLASDLGYVTDVSLSIGRKYRHRGRPRSFLSASCAAPAGFRSAFFSLARGRFSFADGQRLTTTLVRGCRVRPGRGG
jgi:hypothetical protein